MQAIRSKVCTQTRSFATCTCVRAPEASTSSQPAKFTTNKRNHDPLIARHSPDAAHHRLSDRPSVAFTIRAPYSQAPPSMPVSISSAASPILPPLLRPLETPTARLGAAQIAELQSLRLSDPHKWTRSKLAEKYSVSKFFVSTLGFGDSAEAKAAEKDVKEQHQERAAQKAARWGMRKTVDREVRRLRKQHW